MFVDGVKGGVADSRTVGRHKKNLHWIYENKLIAYVAGMYLTREGKSLIEYRFDEIEITLGNVD